MTKTPLLVLLSVALLLVLLDCCSRSVDNLFETEDFVREEQLETADAADDWNDSLLTTTRQSFFRSSSTIRQRRQLLTSSPFKYHIYEFKEFSSKATQWAKQFPNFLRVTTAQAQFNLTAAGGKLNHILYIQDYVTHPLGSASSNALPELLWSGALHGDERVGPTSVMEAAHVLLLAASCEAKLTKFTACRNRLRQTYGINDVQRQWLARLVATRRIVVVPTPNALGYAQNVREENGVDPNRDFPYDLLVDDACMQSVAARTLNEVFRKHMFQLSLTLHGGMEVISYEWGAYSYKGVSPDDQAQKQISAAYSYHGGAFSKSQAYEYGISNKVVYPIRGGMEDWAYAGSWDDKNINPQCAGYPKAKVTYNAGTLRAFNILVEISNNKSPAASTLGTSAQALSRTSTGNGYVSRVMRIAVMSAELVEPYVKLASVNGQALVQDVVPSQKRNRLQCKKSRQVTVASSPGVVSLTWQVGGGMTVDSTQIWYAKWKEDASTETLDCMSQPSIASVKNRFAPGTVTSANKGLGLFADQAGAGTMFRGTIDLSGFSSGDSIVVLVSAQVDQNWKNVPTNAAPDGPPRSHIVNARTNPNWSHLSNGKTVKGRLDWFSIPYTINIQ